MPNLPTASRFVWEMVRLTAKARRLPDDESFLGAAYHAYFRREPDAEGRDYYLQNLKHRNLRWVDVLRSFEQSSEYKQTRGLPVRPLDALHQARMTLIRQCLPQADVIVDLGGAAESDPRGALLLMGYPYQPRTIYIVDLPPEARLLKSPEQARRFQTADGTTIHYLYQTMSAPLPLADGSVDLVFSGESIEHITEEEGDVVCREVYRVLKPGGYFCLDTPNAALTRIQSPGAFIHPEHKKEYYVPELRSKLQAHGFQLVAEQALVPMPETLKTGIFNYKELTSNIRLSDNAEEGYLFYLKAVKPA